MNQIYFFDWIIDKNECEKLNEFFDSCIKRRRWFKWEINEKFRDSEFASTLPEYNEILISVLESELADVLIPIIKQQWVIYQYSKGIWFKPHYDEVDGLKEIYASARNGQPIILWDYTVVLWLSNKLNYCWWELYFPILRESFKLDIWDVLVFPTHREAIHGVKPITSWERRVFVNRAFKNSDTNSEKQGK